MKTLVIAGATALALVPGAAFAEAAQSATEVAAGDALAMVIGIVGTILSALAGLGVELLRRKFNMDADSAALDALRETVDNAIHLTEDAAKDYVSAVTIPVENAYLRGVLGYVLTQAPDEIRRRGYDEQTIANWIASKTGLSAAAESKLR